MHQEMKGQVLTLNNSAHVILDQNDAVWNGETGIFLSGSDHNDLINNTASLNGYYIPDHPSQGIYLYQSDNNVIRDNDVTLNGNNSVYGNAGIYLNISDNNNIMHNYVGNNNGNGILVNGSQSDDFTANNVSENHNSGFELRGSHHITIQDNIVNGNNHGISLDDTNFSRIINNSITWNNNDGIGLFSNSSNNTITRNRVMFNDNAGIGLGSATENNWITSNTITFNGADVSGSDPGIRIKGASNNNIIDNNNSYNYHSGIGLQSAFNNTIAWNLIDHNGPTLFSGYMSGPSSEWAGIALDKEFRAKHHYRQLTLNSTIISGISISNANNNTIYNNYFNNDLNVQTDGTSRNTWNIEPITAPAGGNIIGGPKLAGNYWANPNGTGFSQTAMYDRGDGIVDHQYIIDANNSDFYPLGGIPKPVIPTGGPYVVPSPSLTSPNLPYDSRFIGNDIPKTMQSCHSYEVNIRVENTGTVNWTSKNGVFLLPSSADGFTFEPPEYLLPEGVIVKPGQSFTFPFTINVPCPMKNGTYNLSFVMVHTVTSKTGETNLVPFGERFQYTVTVATPTSGVASAGTTRLLKSAAPKAIIPQNLGGINNQGYLTTVPTVADRQYATQIPVTPVKSPVLSAYLQGAAGLNDYRKSGSPVVQTGSPVLDQKFIKTNNTPAAGFPSFPAYSG